MKKKEYWAVITKRDGFIVTETITKKYVKNEYAGVMIFHSEEEAREYLKERKNAGLNKSFGVHKISIKLSNQP